LLTTLSGCFGLFLFSFFCQLLCDFRFHCDFSSPSQLRRHVVFARFSPPPVLN
jgi:hypothetical protein